MFIIWTGQKLSLLVVETMIHLSYGNFSYSLSSFQIKQQLCKYAVYNKVKKIQMK